MPEFIYAHWLVITCLLAGVSSLVLGWVYLPSLWGAPWFPSSLGTVKEMLRLAQIQPGQKVVDLGAGDGRIVILAARQYHAHAVGVEIDPVRCFIGNTWIRLLGLSGRARIHRGDLFNFDLRDADVVTLYLLKGTNAALKDRLLQQLRPGARIVSNAFIMPDWEPAAQDARGEVFLYQVGQPHRNGENGAHARQAAQPATSRADN